MLLPKHQKTIAVPGAESSNVESCPASTGNVKVWLDVVTATDVVELTPPAGWNSPVAINMPYSVVKRIFVLYHSISNKTSHQRHTSAFVALLADLWLVVPCLFLVLLLLACVLLSIPSKRI